MKSFPQEALMSIGYSHMMRIKVAQKKNLWDMTPQQGRDDVS
jgi:hypothetical protein